jgi:hypothetical protein
MEHGRSNEDLLLDEEGNQSDTPIPSRIVTQGDDSRTFVENNKQIISC